MTVPSTSNRRDFVVDGAPIDFPHRLDRPDELELWTRDATGLKDTKAVYGVDYTVSIAPDFGSASVTLATTFAAAQTGKTCSLLREVSYVQDLNIGQVQRFPDTELEKAHDRSAMRDQQLQEAVDQAESRFNSTARPLYLIKAVQKTEAAAVVAKAAAAEAEPAATVAVDSKPAFLYALLGGL